MERLNEERVVREALRTVGSPRREPTRYGTAVGAYVGAVGYPDAHPRSARTPGPEPIVAVGVDGSPASVMAVDVAAFEAGLRGWDVRVLHVQPRTADPDAGAALLAHLLDRVHAGSPDVPAVTRLFVGSPGPVLVRESATAGLLVVGGPPSGLTSALGGVVVEHVVAHHRGPVLVVRVPAWPSGPAGAVRPIVVGVDGSPGSRTAAVFAAEEARLRGCELVLLHASGARAAADPVEEILGALPPGPVVRQRRVKDTAGRALLRASAQASAVVVGGRGPADPTVGPIARSLIDQGECPVFVVSPTAVPAVPR